jgi:hypothetical protein
MTYNESRRQPAISRRERAILCALIHAACALAWGFDRRRPVSLHAGFRDA